MRNLIISITGFILGGAVVLAIALAAPNKTVQASATPGAMSISGGTMAGMSSGAVRSMRSASLASIKLTIQHVQRGCHVWAHGTMTGPMMRLHLRLGQHLSVLDQDVDPHQMLEFAGPMRLHMGGPMMTSHGTTIVFTKKGVYHLGTKTVEMPGMGGMDVKTIGPDNKLRLVVTVA